MQHNDKQILAQTMRRLITSINNNKQQQLKIFQSLSREDILKILQNFDHSHESVRKMSARLITELLFENNAIKERLIEILGVNPGVGNIVLNKVPAGVEGEKVLEIMRMVRGWRGERSAEGRMMCWYVNPFEGEGEVQVVESGSFKGGDFLDPGVCIFGISSWEVRGQGLEIPTLMFKELEHNTYAQPSAIKPVTMSDIKTFKPLQNPYSLQQPQPQTSPQPLIPNNEKIRFTFSSRQRTNTISQQPPTIPFTKIGQLCFRTDKNLRFNHNFGAATDRNRVEDKSLSPSQNAPLTSSMHFRTRDSEVKGGGLGKFKVGIELTSPTSVNSNPVRFRDRNERSEEKKDIIVLGGIKNNRDLTTSSNTSNLNKAPIMFNAKSPTTPSNSKNLTSLTPNNNNPHKIDYMKIISQFKTASKQQPSTKMYGDYKPADDFLQKIKESIKTRD